MQSCKVWGERWGRGRGGGEREEKENRESMTAYFRGTVLLKRSLIPPTTSSKPKYLPKAHLQRPSCRLGLQHMKCRGIQLSPPQLVTLSPVSLSSWVLSRAVVSFWLFSLHTLGVTLCKILLFMEPKSHCPSFFCVFQSWIEMSAFLSTSKEIFVEASSEANGTEWDVCFHRSAMNHLAVF
jgi:hypothetical protein